MSGTAIYCKPSFRFSPHIVNHSLKSLKHIPFHHFPTSKTVSLGGFVLKKVVIEEKRILETKIMTELVRASAFQSNNGCEEEAEEEGLKLLKNEATLSSSWTSGIEWSLNRLSKWLVATLFGFVVLWRHDAEIMWAAIGAVLNGMLSVALKGILNQKRPIPTLRSDPGMPSSHAQSIFFALSFAILSTVTSMGFNKVTVSVGVLALAFSSYLSWLRVSQRLHTISQVVVGATLGSICSILWFQAWQAFVLKAFISFLWVRIVVVMGGATACVSFLLYVIKHWVMAESSGLIKLEPEICMPPILAFIYYNNKNQLWHRLDEHKSKCSGTV